LHHASTEVGAHVVLLDDRPVGPGATVYVQLVLERPIAAAIPDRYVIRDVSGQRTMGGGSFIDLRPPTRRRRTAERQAQRDALAIAGPLTAFKALLTTPPFAWNLTVFARDRVLSAAKAKGIEDESGLIALEIGGSKVALAPDRWRSLVGNLTEQLESFHSENPDLQGIGREKLRLLSQPRLPAPEFAAALQRMASAGEVVLDGSFVRLTTHAVRLSPGDEEVWAAIQPLLGGEDRFRPPRVRDVATATTRPERDVRRILKLASRMGWTDEIAHDHFFLRGAVHEMVGIVADLAARADNGVFTAAQFRDRVENGRKVAIQILDFFDRHGVTVNKNDLRHTNKYRLDLFGPVVVWSNGIQGRESSPVGRSDFKSE
jgi:selenocysteine-specific elongation factor